MVKHKSELEFTREYAEAALKQISPRYRLKSMKEIDVGICNLVYFLKNQYNQEFVLRVCNPHWESYKIQKETAILDLVRARTSVPTPKVLVSDTSKSVMPYTYMLYKKIEGRNLGNSIAKIKDKESIARSMGNYLAQIHGITFKKCGDIRDRSAKPSLVEDIKISNPKYKKFGPYETWRDMFKALTAMQINGLRYTDFSRFGPRFEEWYKRRFRQIPLDITPTLLHKDYAMDNMIEKDGKIAAVIDYEWSIIGDSEYDFYRAWWKIRQHGLEDAFTEAYTEKRPLSDAYGKKAVLYEASNMVNGMIAFKWCAVNWSEKKIETRYKKMCKDANAFLRKHA